MKGMEAYRPVSRQAGEVEELFRADPVVEEESNPWVQTSLRFRLKTRNRVKAYAAVHGLTMQEVLEDCLTMYLDQHE